MHKIVFYLTQHTVHIFCNNQPLNAVGGNLCLLGRHKQHFVYTVWGKLKLIVVLQQAVHVVASGVQKLICIRYRV